MPNPPYVYNGNLWAGSQWFSGTGVPNPSLGKNGDFFLRSDTDQVYTKISGTWTVTQDLTGFTGSRGDLGFTGSRGFTGSQGFTGSASTVQGPQGFTGSQGDQGFTGSFGSRGYTGSQGFIGSRGFTGSTGIGFTGSEGLQGFTGSKGSDGFTGSTGFTGSQGATPYQILSGTNPPSSGAGNNGDFWINTQNWQIYGPKAGGVWPSGVQITGVNANIMFVIDGQGGVISTGLKGDLEIPFNCTIVGARMFGDTTGSVVLNIFKNNYATYPSALTADSICALNKPTITSAQKYEDISLLSWTRPINAGDILRFNVDSCTSITRLTISLTVTRT